MEEFYKTLDNNSKDRSDRYRNCKVLEDEDTGDIILSTIEDIDIYPRSSDIFHRVKSHEVCRLDILAHQYYRNPLLWWIIAKANNIYNPFKDIEPGTLLRIPNIESLYGNNGILL